MPSAARVHAPSDTRPRAPEAADANTGSALSACPPAQLAAAQSASAVAIIDIDRAGRLVRFNDAFCGLVGRTRAWLEAADLDAICPQDPTPDGVSANAGRSDGATSHGLRSFCTAERAPCERRLRHANGRWVWTECTSVTVPTTHAGSAFERVTLVDISARKTLQRRLGSLAAVVEQTSDFVAIFDPQLDVQYINVSGLRLLGLGTRCEFDALGMPGLLDWIWPDDLERVRTITIPTLERSGRWSGRIRFRHATRETPLETVFAVEAIHDDNGRLSGYSTISPDLGQMIAAEQALRKTSDELAEANRQKDRVLSRLGHELRNPMHALDNGLALVAEPAGEHADLFAMMQRQSRHLVSLINDLVDVASAHSGHLRVSRHVAPLAAFVAEVVEERRYETGPLGIRLELVIERDAEALHAAFDEGRLRQVLNNLLGNAIRASRGTRRAGRITVTLERIEDRASIAVADNGRGIEAIHLERIFRPFERLSDDRADGGLGLGLAIARELVLRHEGALTVASDGPGHGATFRVALPLVEVDADAPAPDTSRPSAEDEPRAAREPSPEASGTVSDPLGRRIAIAPVATRRIVIIDDECDASEAMRRMLERFGHEAHRASDGPSGIALALEVQPDIVICDIGMPGMNGFEVARSLRERELFAGTRLIGLTGFADERTAREALSAGFDEHVAKPLSGERLRALVAAPTATGALAA